MIELNNAQLKKMRLHGWVFRYDDKSWSDGEWLKFDPYGSLLAQMNSCIWFDDLAEVDGEILDEEANRLLTDEHANRLRKLGWVFVRSWVKLGRNGGLKIATCRDAVWVNDLASVDYGINDLQAHGMMDKDWLFSKTLEGKWRWGKMVNNTLWTGQMPGSLWEKDLAAVNNDKRIIDTPIVVPSEIWIRTSEIRWRIYSKNQKYALEQKWVKVRGSKAHEDFEWRQIPVLDERKDES